MMGRKVLEEKWQAVCKIVDKRDKTCRLLKCLTPGEIAIIGNKGKARLDRAHFYAKSTHPQFKYCINNIYKINHFSHINLDNCQCPLTGVHIERNKRDWWWFRIIYKKTNKYNSELCYQELLSKSIMNAIKREVEEVS
jgi:hypothetical protein